MVLIEAARPTTCSLQQALVCLSAMALVLSAHPCSSHHHTLVQQPCKPTPVAAHSFKPKPNSWYLLLSMTWLALTKLPDILSGNKESAKL